MLMESILREELFQTGKPTQKHRYEVIKINSESCAGEVELTLEDKKNCDDSKFPQNYSNYVEIAKSVTNKNDKKALSIYKQSNGVPYYMNGMDSNNNKGARKLRADEILNWSEQEILNPEDKKLA